MDNYIITGVLVGLFSGIIGFLVKAKRRGDKCIGCPHSRTCGKKEKTDCKGDK
jgi:hypothetical protein